MLIINILVYAFLAYIISGLVFGIWFIFKGVGQIDHGMEGAKWGMRLLLLPGSIGLWPVLLSKVLKSKNNLH